MCTNPSVRKFKHFFFMFMAIKQAANLSIRYEYSESNVRNMRKIQSITTRASKLNSNWSELTVLCIPLNWREKNDRRVQSTAYALCTSMPVYRISRFFFCLKIQLNLQARNRNADSNFVENIKFYSWYFIEKMKKKWRIIFQYAYEYGYLTAFFS